jgi:hypothetical protein
MTFPFNSAIVQSINDPGRQVMKESNLIDMFGLGGDPSSDDRLEKLFFCLESDESDTSFVNSGAACLPSMITITTSGFEHAVLHTLR